MYSRDLPERIFPVPVLQRTEAHTLPSEIDKAQSGEFNMVVEIPPGFRQRHQEGQESFSRALDRRHHAVSGRDHQELCRGCASFYLTDLVHRSSIPWFFIHHVQPRYWYNPLIESKYSIVPGLLAVVLMLVPCMLTAIGVVREKEFCSIATSIQAP